MKKIRVVIKNMVMLLLASATLMTMGFVNPNETLSVRAEETGAYYGDKINTKGQDEEKKIVEAKLDEPEVKNPEKTGYEHLTLDGYVEDKSQREADLKVFVKGDTEKRLYYLSQVHVLDNGEWLDPDEVEQVSRLRMVSNEISLIANDLVLAKFNTQNFEEIQKGIDGFTGSKELSVSEMIPFETGNNIVAELNDSKTTILYKSRENGEVLGTLVLSVNETNFKGTSYQPVLDLQVIDEDTYGVSLNAVDISAFGAIFNVDVQGAITTTYDSSKVSLFGVRSGAVYKSHSYNPGGYIASINNVVIGNGNYNDGYIFCAGSCVAESQNNYGIISFFNGTPLSNVIGTNRTVSNAKLVMYYNTHPDANDGQGAVYQTYMLDPNSNFDVADPSNITYDNFQNYLGNSSTPVASGSPQTASGYNGFLTFDLTHTMQSWENSGNHHGIMIRGESKSDGSFLEAAHYFYNHTHADVSKRPYIEITTVKNEPVPDNLPLDSTTLFLRPFTVNSRANNVLQFSALGFDGITKPGSKVKVFVKDVSGNSIFTDENVASDGYRRFSQYTTQLGYNLPDNVQTYYRLTSNYQEKNLLYNTNFQFNKLYKVSYQSTYGGQSSSIKNSDEFLIYKVTAYDRLPRLLAFYGITDKVQFMQDNNMADELLVEGNVLFIRNPKKNKDKIYQPAALSENDKRMIDNNLLGRNQHCVYGYEPINFNTGNFYYTNPDTGSIDYDKEILFERTYNSLANGRVGLFGRNWTLNLYKELYFLSNGNIEFSDGTGRVLTFEKDGNGFKTPFDSNYSIEKVELRREIITVDNDYYDQDETPKTVKKEVIHYGYRITDANTHEELKFDEVGNITSYKRSQYELPITYEYNSYNLSAINTPAGRKFTIALNDMGLISSITDPEGNVLNYGYDDSLNLITFNDQMGYEINYNYDNAYRMVSYTGREKDDLVVQNIYDNEGRIISQKDALGQESKFTYFTNRTEIINFKGNITTVYKDSNGYTSRVVEADAEETSKEFDSRGNLVSEVKANGQSFTYEYNAENRLSKETNQFGQVKTYQYDGNSNITTITDFNGERTTFTYDSQNRLTGSYYPNGSTELKTYNNQNQVTYEKDIYNLEKNYTYTNGSLTSISYSDGTKTTYTYTLLGNLKSETDEVGNTIKYDYDSRSQLTSVQYPHHTESFVYDGDGHKVSEVDGNGNRTNYTFDAWSRVIEVQDSSGTTKYAYDENGNVVKVIDALGFEGQFEYDTQNRVIKSIDKLGRVTEYTYDDKGNLVKTINPKGQQKEFYFNDLNQLVKETFIDQVQTYEYDGNGNLIKVVDPYGSVLQYKYDNNGLLIETVDDAGFVTRFVYDGARLISKEYKGLIWTYDYDVRGNKTKEIDPLERLTETVYTKHGFVKSTSLSGLASLESEYDGDGRIASVSDAEGFTKEYQYDGNGNITEVKDENGNITKHQYDHHNKIIETVSPEGYRYEYEYDAMGQLIKESWFDVINNTTLVYMYKYDAIGNQILKTDAIDRDITYEYDELNQLVRTNQYGRESTIVYDDYGRKIQENNYLKETYHSYNEKGQLEMTKDSLGYRIEFIYNEKGQLIETKNELEQKEEYEYNDMGYLAKSINNRGLTNTYETNVLNETVKSIDPFGNESSYAYNAMGQLIFSKVGSYEYNVDFDVRGHVSAQTDNVTEKMFYSYDGNGNITETQNGQRITKSTYDKENRVIVETDAIGNSVKYQYNILNQVVQTIYPDDSITQFKYDNAGRLIMKVDQLGFETLFEYDTYDNVIVETNALGDTIKSKYDEKGNLVEVSEPLGKETKYEYDQRNREVKNISPNGNVIKTTYTDFDEIETVTYPNGLIQKYKYNEYFELIEEGYDGRSSNTSYTYDEYGRQKSETNKLGNTIYLSYDNYGNLIKTDVNGQTIETEFDEFNRVIKTVDERGYETYYSYNKYNQKSDKEDNLGYKEWYIYDEKGRLSEMHTELGIVSYEYDAFDRTIKSIDVNGAETLYEYDERGQLLKQTNPLGATVLNHYDELGRLVETIDERGNKKTFEFNALNEVVAYQEDSGVVLRYNYDLEGNLVETRYKDERVEKRSYDEMNQLVALQNVDKTQDSFKYDKFGNLIEGKITNKVTKYTYNNKDQIIKKTSGADTYEYEFNEWGSITKATLNGRATKISYSGSQEILEVMDENNQVVRYNYDTKGRQTDIVYPSGKHVKYRYDEFDRLVEVSDQESKTIYEHDAVGNVILETTGDLVTNRSFNLMGDLVTQEVKKSDKTISSLSYTRNERSDVLTEISNQDGKITTKTYEYDDANQIISELVDTDKNKVTSQFTYDIWGNKERVTKNKNGVKSETRYLYNNKKQLIETRTKEDSIKLKYDDYGNVIQKSYSNGLIENYRFDDFNQLIGIEDNYGKVTEFGYDALGERVSRQEELPYNYLVLVPESEKNIDKEYDMDSIFSKAQDAVLKTLDDKYYCTITFKDNDIKTTSETFVNDITTEDTEVLQVNRDDKVYESYTYGLNRIKSESKETSNYHISNGKLDIIGTINDTVTSWFNYGINGDTLTLSAPRFGYSSESHDGSLQYLRARYYDTEIGVFLSQDTYRGDQMNQRSQNRYIYTENNSVNNIDPSGHFLKGLFNGAKKIANDIGKQINKGLNEIGKFANAAGKVLNTAKNAIVNSVTNIAKGIGNTINKVIINPVVQHVQKGYEVVKAVVTHDTEKQLTFVLAETLNQMRKSGFSDEDIQQKQMELIRKYCEIFNLDEADLIESKSFQEKLEATFKKNAEVQQANQDVRDAAWAVVTAPVTAVKQIGSGIATIADAGGQALQGNWAEAGKLALKGVGDIAGGTATLGLMVGSVALAVASGGTSIPFSQAALAVAGTSFTVAKSGAIIEGSIGVAELAIGSLSGDQDYADEGASDVISSLIKIVAANKGQKSTEKAVAELEEIIRKNQGSFVGGMSPEDAARYNKQIEQIKAGTTQMERYDASVEQNGVNENLVKGTRNPVETQKSVDTKLDKYLLDKNHPVGGSKAEWFDQALGYNQSNQAGLSKQIVFDANSAIETGITEFGTKYNQVISITGTNGRVIDVTFAWIKNNDGIIRLVTAIPTKP